MENQHTPQITNILNFEFKKVKKLGSNNYYISKNKKFFIKESKYEVKILKQEYNNIKKIWKKIDIDDLDTLEPIDFIEEEGRLFTRNIEAQPLANILNPNIYYKFGQKLREFHKKGFSHSHLEFNDILYKNGKYILTDLPYLNNYPPIFDLITLDINNKIFIIKRPWFWIKYHRCFKYFLKGYDLNTYLGAHELYKREMEYKINYLSKENKLFSKFKSLILKFIYKTDLIKWM